MKRVAILLLITFFYSCLACECADLARFSVKIYEDSLLKTLDCPGIPLGEIVPDDVLSRGYCCPIYLCDIGCPVAVKFPGKIKFDGVGGMEDLDIDGFVYGVVVKIEETFFSERVIIQCCAGEITFFIKLSMGGVERLTKKLPRD